MTFKCDLDLPTYDFFFTKNPNLKKKKKILVGGGVSGGGGGVDGWTDEQAQTNLPLQLLQSWGHNNALMYKLSPWQAQFMTIISFDLQVWPWPSTYQPTIFFHKESKFKKTKEFSVGVGGVSGGRGRWMDRWTGPNQFPLSTYSKLGA